VCYLDTANRAKHTIGVYARTAFDLDIWWRIHMSSQESFDELEPRITGLVEEAIREIKEEFLQRLQDTRTVLDELLGQAAETLEEAAAAEVDTLETEAAEPVEVPAALPADLLPGLHAAVASLDRCRTQDEILSSLVESAGAFASRASLFLTHEEGLQGWSSHGFREGDEAFEALVLEYDEGSPWGRLAEGRGVIELDATECAELCSRIDNSSPLSGALIPIVLRDHLAAALYADQIEDDESVGLSALQLLAYMAAQALETLPLRERSSTATLRLATESPSGEPVLTLWQFTAPEVEVSIADEIEAVVEPAIEEEAEDLYAAEPVEEIPVAEHELEEGVDFEQVEDVVEEAQEEAVEAVDFEEAIEAAEEAVDLEEAEEEVESVEAIDFEQVEDVVEEAEEAQEEAVEAVDFEEAIEAAEEAVDLEEVEEEVEIAAEADLQPVEETGFDVEEPATEEESAEPAPEIADEEIEAPQEPAVEPEPAAAIMDGSEIRPPEDAQGPGWAFTTNRFSADSGGEAIHEEARRLARLLVTEIKLYNEEQVEAGRRNRNVYEVLREDIDRSRQIYEERIDDDVRNDADYFHDELVRILAGGESEILGL